MPRPVANCNSTVFDAFHDEEEGWNASIGDDAAMKTKKRPCPFPNNIDTDDDNDEFFRR